MLVLCCSFNSFEGIRDKKIVISVIRGINTVAHRIIYHVILLVVVIPFDHSDTILMTMLLVSSALISLLVILQL